MWSPALSLLAGRYCKTLHESAGSSIGASSLKTDRTVRAGMLAADGRCKTLDASADGYVRSEGVAALQLRVVHSLGGEPQAPPHLLVLGTAVNQDGRSSSLTAPSGPAQQALLKAALASASLPPSKVSNAHCRPASCAGPGHCCQPRRAI